MVRHSLAWPLQRVGSALATAAVAVAVLFALLLLAPGDAIDLVGDDASRASLAAQFGYDRGPAARFAAYLWRAAHGDLGTSVALRPGMPVSELLGARVGASLGTLAAATALLAGLGTGLATLTHGRRSALRTAVQVVSSPPAFLLAFTAVTLLNAATWALVERGVVARPAWFALPDEASWVRTGLAVLVLAVGSGTLAQVHAELEDHLSRLVRSPWIDAALGRGEPTSPLLLRGLLPVLVSALADRAALLAGALVVVEKVLLVPGVGATLFDAAVSRDADVVCAAALGATAWVVGVQLAADAARAALDPRLRP